MANKRPAPKDRKKPKSTGKTPGKNKKPPSPGDPGVLHEGAKVFRKT